MSAIAAEAGVAKGTIYLYFRDREELIERVAQEAFEELSLELEEVFQARGPFRQRFLALIERIFGFFDGRREFFRLFLSVRHPEGSTPAECRRKESPHYNRYLELLGGFLAQAIAAGEVRPGDPERLALFVSEGIHALLLRRIQEDRSPAPAEEAAWITSMFLDGIMQPQENHA
jgi:AcrR family transcriptional regulator